MMFPKRPGRALATALAIRMLVAAVLLPVAFAVQAGPAPCPDDGMLSVDAPRAELGRKLCAIARQARNEMDACGLVQHDAIRIEIVEKADHALEACLAQFDCRTRSIRLVDPADFPEVLHKGDPYTQLSPDALLTALVNHEMAHALLFQSPLGEEIRLVDHEYVAAAMELESLDAGSRDMLLAASPVSQPPDPAFLNATIYFMAPRKFAAAAWQHFSLPENGCRLVRQIVSGEFSFAGGQ